MWKALSLHKDYERYKLPPRPGGLEEQPYDWKQAMDCVFEAKEWAEALGRLNVEVIRIENSLDGKEDPGEDELEELEEARETLKRLDEIHRKKTEALREAWSRRS